jgi:hypothetical protein
MKRSIHCVLHRRLKPLTRNTNRFTGKLSKTKGNVKDGTPSNHLEEAESRDLGRLSVLCSGGSRKPAQEQSNSDQIASEIAVAFTIVDAIQFCFVPAIDHTGTTSHAGPASHIGSIFGHIQHQMIIKPSSGIHISLLSMPRPREFS